MPIGKMICKVCQFGCIPTLINNLTNESAKKLKYLKKPKKPKFAKTEMKTSRFFFAASFSAFSIKMPKEKSKTVVKATIPKNRQSHQP